MAKYALLVGVSEYEEPTLKPLPGATKDVKEIQEILQNPEIGDFPKTNIKLLENPDRHQVEEAIYDLFIDLKKDDLALFYFSGHGITDKLGQFYLATHRTRKEGTRVRDITAVSAKYLQEKMTQSLSEQQVIILDCCFSGAFAKGMTAKSDDTINIQQLGGKGRAVLASSSSTQYTFEHRDSGFGIYTHYVLEAIQKGVAASDKDGWISVDELHEYVSSKVKQYCLEQNIYPPMTPEIYAVKEGYKIHLVKSPIRSVPLSNSEVDANYTKLKELLKAEQFKEADQVTAAIMLGVSGRTEQGWLGLEDIESFPCKDLNTIDKLWEDYSKQRFGFDVQKRIWREVQAKQGKADYSKFAERVGWRVGESYLEYDNFTFTLRAPRGHFPALTSRFWLFADWRENKKRNISLFSRLEACCATPADIQQLVVEAMNAELEEQDYEKAKALWWQVIEADMSTQSDQAKARKAIDRINSRIHQKTEAYEQRRAEEEQKKAAERQRELERQQELEQQQQEQFKQEAAEKRRQAEEQERQRQEAEQLKEAQRQQVAQTGSKDELASEKGIDYTELRNLLAAGKWQEADQTTNRVMCEVSGRRSQGMLQQYLDVEDIDKFPCEDLRSINQLWLHYSNGKFGFSVQKEIYESLGGTREHNGEVWEKFCDRVGWGKVEYSEWGTPQDISLTFNLELAPQGHLPCRLYCIFPEKWGVVRCNSDDGWNIKKGRLSFLVQRLVDCSR
jgi:GUN4-like/Caspase domain